MRTVYPCWLYKGFGLEFRLPSESQRSLWPNNTNKMRIIVLIYSVINSVNSDYWLTCWVKICTEIATWFSLFRIKELYENVLQYSDFIILCLLDVIIFANCIYCFLLSSYCAYNILFLLITLYLDMSLNSFLPLISCHCQYVTLYQWNILSAVPGQSLFAMSLLSCLWITVQERKLRHCKKSTKLLRSVSSYVLFFSLPCLFSIYWSSGGLTMHSSRVAFPLLMK